MVDSKYALLGSVLKSFDQALLGFQLEEEEEDVCGYEFKVLLLFLSSQIHILSAEWLFEYPF